MIYLHLILVFFRIGLFTFGGGYAMLPLMQQEIARFGWLTQQEFVDILAIAEMTPGAISVNAATFVGFRTGGLLGALAATAALAAPSLVLIITMARLWEAKRDHPLIKALFAGIRPVVAGLIIGAAVIIAGGVLVPDNHMPTNLAAEAPELLRSLDIRLAAVAAAVFILVYRFKRHPIAMIVVSGLAGLVLFI